MSKPGNALNINSAGLVVNSTTGGLTSFQGNTTTQYSVLTNSGVSTAPISSSLGAGTAGNILIGTQNAGWYTPVNGAGTTMTSNSTTFQPAINGGYVLIQTQRITSSTAAMSFTSGITSTYNSYLLLINNAALDTVSQELQVQLSTNGGSSYLGGTNYQSGQMRVAYNSGTITNVNIQSGLILMVSTSGFIADGAFYLFNMTSNTIVSMVGTGNKMGASASYIYKVFGAANSAGNITVNAIQLNSTSGNITSLTASLYGILE